jgi:hypothetical protein
LSFELVLDFFQHPVFSFQVWIRGLIGAVILGYAMTPLVHRGGKVIRAITIVLGIIMTMNALGHLLGSIYLARTLPGMLSSPFLLLSALFVVAEGFRENWIEKRFLNA